MAQIDWQKIQSEVVEHLRALVRVDTTNPPGNERPAAEYIAGVCEKAGLKTEVVESGGPNRGNVVARMVGNGKARPVLLLSHLDVVPAEPSKWTHPPFGGDLAEGYVWGRGSVDSKLTAAVGLTTLLLCARTGTALKRDLILAATADEEMGGPANGAAWLANNRKDLIDAEYVINEGGGFALEIGGKRFYVCQTAEKGACDVDLIGKGMPGHASVPHDDNAIVHLAESVVKLGSGRLGFHVTETARGFFEKAAAAQDSEENARLLRDMLDPKKEPETFCPPPYGRPHAVDVRRHAPEHGGPHDIKWGGKTECHPFGGEPEHEWKAAAGPDEGIHHRRAKREGRRPGGNRRRPMAGGKRVEPGLAPFEAMDRAIKRVDPEGQVVPFLITGGTDAHQLDPINATVYGFLPMRYEPGWAYFDLCHGHDERISEASVGSV